MRNTKEKKRKSKKIKKPNLKSKQKGEKTKYHHKEGTIHNQFEYTSRRQKER